MSFIRIPVPKLTASLLSNVIGFLALVAICVAIGGLTSNWWWTLLAGGLFGIAIAYMLGVEDTESEPDAAPREE